jgi:YVTN family beta-propeller protein
VAGGLAAALVAVGIVAAMRTLGGDDPESRAGVDTVATSVPVPAAPTTTTVPPVPSDARRLRLVRTVTGNIAPKSVVASGTGIVTAQNMMYRHSVTVYDADGNLVATIPDSVDLAAFGILGHPGVSRGAPVEAAFTPDKRHFYVTNYSMYGEGFGPEGADSCTRSQHFDDSFVYRIDVASLAIDQVIPVGSVPKYVEVTPDGTQVLVTNWCSYDMTVVDAKTATAVARVALGAWPRGIAVDPASKTAYVAVMGDNTIVRVDLTTRAVTATWPVGVAPRHVVMDATGAFLYVTLNGEGNVVKIDAATGGTVAKARSGTTPRTMVMAPDGRSLYVVNYDDSTITKMATADLSVLQVLATNEHPIGVTFEPTKGRLWVAGYAGSLQLYDDV